MANLNLFRYEGSWVTVGSAQFCASAYISLDSDNCNMNTTKGFVRCGYKTKNISSGGTIGMGYLKNSQGKQLSVSIDDHSTGWYFASSDVTFEQSNGTQLRVYSEVGYTDGSGTKYVSVLDKTITLYQPCPRNFDELNLVVNGVKITQNCQVVKVESIYDEVEISFNAYASYCNTTPTFGLYSIAYMTTGSSNLKITGTSQPYDEGSPTVERLTIKDTVKNLVATYTGPRLPNESGVMFNYEASMLGSVIKKDLSGSGYSDYYVISPGGGLLDTELVKQFYEANKLGLGCVCFTLVNQGSWGNSSARIYYCMSNNPAFDCKGPSFVLYVGPFVKYKDLDGVVHDAKLGTTYETSGGEHYKMSLYDGQFKDLSGNVHDIV